MDKPEWTFRLQYSFEEKSTRGAWPECGDPTVKKSLNKLRPASVKGEGSVAEVRVPPVKSFRSWFFAGVPKKVCNFRSRGGFSQRVNNMSAGAIIDQLRTVEELEGPHQKRLHKGQQFCRLGVPLKPLHCPACQSPIYSRRQPRCGVCEAPLPQQMLFNREELARVNNLLIREEENHKAWMNRWSI